MKYVYFLLLCVISFSVANAQKQFITIWNTANAGITKSNQIFLNATGSHFNVSWVNTTNAADTNHTTINGNDTITFASAGTYKVYITPGSGSFSAVKLYSYGLGSYGGDNQKLLSIEQWGDIQWSTFDSAFMGCGNMVMNAADVPNLSNVINMSAAFQQCSKLSTNAAMANWNVSHVTDMSFMFSYDIAFNEPIGNWDVSNVTTTKNMFSSANIFNQPLNNWNVGKVTDMSFMFFLATGFNQSINNWNVSKVITMQQMFDYDTSFNQPLNNWDVSNVTNMQAMFDVDTHFNQPIGNWNVSKVINMSFMFERDIYFNQSLNNWNVSNVTDMSDMFLEAYAFNQPLGNWNVSKVNKLNSMFAETKVFNQPLAAWNVSNVSDMSGMFAYTTAFNQPVDNWNVGNVTAMYGMFNGAQAFNQPLADWNTGKVTNMAYMFAGSAYYGLSKFNQPINSWNVSKVTDMSYMFQGNTVFNQPLNSWNVGNVTNMSFMFSDNTAFNQSIGNWNVSNVTNMSQMFAGNTIFNQPITNWNVSNVTDMSYMFYNNTAFNQSIGNWNVAKVTDMTAMFLSAKLFNQPINKWNVSSVTYTYTHPGMNAMFKNAKAFDQNIGSWNLSGQPSLLYMFDSSAMSCSNYSATLRGWANNTSTPNNLSLGAASLTYDAATAKAAHDSLTDLKSWTISGDKIGNCSLLPVNFISFTATQQKSTVLLNWKVANEINVKGYNVEKSNNSINYNRIGFVSADEKFINYNYTDNNLSEGISYYRIKEVDNDGKFMYSSTQQLTYSKFSWKINANPINNSSITLMLDKPANISVQIISSNGNLIKTIQKGNLMAGDYNIPLNIDNVDTGIYLVRLLIDDKTYAATVIK